MEQKYVPIIFDVPLADDADVIAALTANPALRLRVLAHFWSPDEIAASEKRAAELWQAVGEPALRERAEAAEAELAKLRAELVEILRNVHSAKPQGSVVTDCQIEYIADRLERGASKP